MTLTAEQKEQLWGLADECKQSHISALEKTRASDFSIDRVTPKQLFAYQEQYAAFNQAIEASLTSFHQAMRETETEQIRRKERLQTNITTLEGKLEEKERDLRAQQEILEKTKADIVILQQLDEVPLDSRNNPDYISQAKSVGLREERVIEAEKVSSRIKALQVLQGHIETYRGAQEQIERCRGVPGPDSVRAQAAAETTKKEVYAEIKKIIAGIPQPDRSNIKNAIRKEMDAYRELHRHSHSRHSSTYWIHDNNKDVSLQHALLKKPDRTFLALESYIGDLYTLQDKTYGVSTRLSKKESRRGRFVQKIKEAEIELEGLKTKKGALQLLLSEAKERFKPDGHSFWAGTFVEPLTYEQIEEKMQTTLKLYVQFLNRPQEKENRAKLHENIQQWRRDVHRIEGGEIRQSVGSFIVFVLLSGLVFLGLKSAQPWVDAYYYFARDAAFGQIGHGLDEIESACLQADGLEENPLIKTQALSDFKTGLFDEYMEDSEDEEPLLSMPEPGL